MSSTFHESQIQRQRLLSISLIKHWNHFTSYSRVALPEVYAKRWRSQLVGPTGCLYSFVLCMYRKEKETNLMPLHLKRPWDASYMKNVSIISICSNFLNFGSNDSQKTIFLAVSNGSWSLMYTFFLSITKSHEAMYTVPLKMTQENIFMRQVPFLSGRLGNNAQKGEIRQC